MTTVEEVVSSSLSSLSRKRMKRVFHNSKGNTNGNTTTTTTTTNNNNSSNHNSYNNKNSSSSNSSSSNSSSSSSSNHRNGSVAIRFVRRWARPPPQQQRLRPKQSPQSLLHQHHPQPPPPPLVLPPTTMSLVGRRWAHIVMRMRMMILLLLLLLLGMLVGVAPVSSFSFSPQAPPRAAGGKGATVMDGHEAALSFLSSSSSSSLVLSRSVLPSCCWTRTSRTNMRPSPSEPCPPDAEEDTPGTPLLPTLEARPPALPKQLPPSPSSLPGRRRRRQVLLSTTWILPLLLSMTGGLGPAQAATATTRSLPTTTTTTSTTTIQDDSTPPPPKVTDRVYFNVRISRSDGTFYVRDKKNDGDSDDDNNQDDQVFYARLVFELFGEVAPVTVQRFKSYLPTTTAALAMDDTDRPLPSYARSSFASYDEATGVIYGGQIPGLQVVEVNNGGGGGSALQYGNRLFPASLWLESRSTTKLRHVGKGLLTHALLDPTPVFGITTRTDTTELDATHVVFGRLVVSEPDDQERNVNRNNTEKNAADAPTTWHSGAEFLQRVAALPTYQAESSVVMRRSDEYNEGGFVEAAAQSIFQAQRSFFRNTAQALGDTRLDRVYTGKLLRRVEVTQAEILE